MRENSLKTSTNFKLVSEIDCAESASFAITSSTLVRPLSRQDSVCSIFCCNTCDSDFSKLSLAADLSTCSKHSASLFWHEDRAALSSSNAKFALLNSEF